ncbi:hypothetical protein FGO68_gene3672 [Halteria grandinella]|uniref:Uncharacterized protein n=1 Tax=Halteria grandinella TaxID=5974 RepID=A0A8J8NWJ5_HALGN|nr:hypothetical protein FGO68_gene3672 [Halteria grandinella]
MTTSFIKLMQMSLTSQPNLHYMIRETYTDQRRVFHKNRNFQTISQEEESQELLSSSEQARETIARLYWLMKDRRIQLEQRAAPLLA